MSNEKPKWREPHPLEGFAESQLDAVDAGVFSGDGYHSDAARQRMAWYIARWSRELGLSDYIQGYGGNPNRELMKAGTAPPEPGLRGTLHVGQKMFLRMHCGSATKDDGTKFEMSTNAVGGHPIVYCETTKKWFTLGWEDILAMAEEAGVAK